MYRVTGTFSDGKRFAGNLDARDPLDAIESARKKLPKDSGDVTEIKAKKIDDNFALKVTEARARKPRTDAAAAPAASNKKK